MAGTTGTRWRHVLPWIVSIALLVYVFGWATDWKRLEDAMRAADVPLFLLFASADRIAFFLVWTLLQALALRRFVAHVPVRSVVAVRGGSELLRTVSNPLSDAAFFLGLGELAGRRVDAVLASALVPMLCHFLVMLAMMTLALPFLPGGIGANGDVAWTAGVLWAIWSALGTAALLAHRGRVRFPGADSIRDWMLRFPLAKIRPFLLGFVALVLFDVTIQQLGSRAFGVEIPWVVLAARIPILYLWLTVPTLGNFGTRELAWAGLFSEYGDRDTLLAYALGTNAVFLVLNLALGLLFLPRALQLLATVRRARSAGDPIPEPLLHDPTDL
ncbi:MAG: lysylphosphatidylglycerol synthase domain-containing protein [Myxococcota bacterium]|jgi:hypothetical protein|nr:lysylphosphatidylglycerol synthase domain-containing protein [Myxococcota bacterium]